MPSLLVSQDLAHDVQTAMEWSYCQRHICCGQWRCGTRNQVSTIGITEYDLILGSDGHTGSNRSLHVNCWHYSSGKRAGQQVVIERYKGINIFIRQHTTDLLIIPSHRCGNLSFSVTRSSSALRCATCIWVLLGIFEGT